MDDPLHRVIEDGELVHPGENHPSKIVTWAINDFEKMGRAVFLKRLTRALANKPSRKRKRKLENNREDDQSFQIAQLARPHSEVRDILILSQSSRTSLKARV